MCDSMTFPATVDEFMEEYKVIDSEHVYSNGMEMVPIFRMKQWFEHEADHNAEPGKMVADTISRQVAIDKLSEKYVIMDNPHYIGYNAGLDEAERVIKALPSVQPEHNAEVSKMGIIRCKDCKHWNLQVGNVKGDGLGSCDFHNVNLVTGEGFCYWADRRGNKDGTD